MSAELGARRRNRALPPHTSRVLEELVGTVAALDGARAASLLSGLSDALRPTALELLRRVERCGRPERHARLASAFVPCPAALATAEEIPGRLGREVRKLLASRRSTDAASSPERMGRWARRLVLERGGR